MNKKAFTLIELMVAMGVLAVLVGMSIFGIQAVLRSQRDTQRRSNASNLQLEIQGYQNTYGVYPSGANVRLSGNTVTIIQPDDLTVYKSMELDGPAASASNTDSSRTAYCYESPDGVSYRLAVMVESLQWEQFGNDTTNCTSITSTN